MHRNPFAGACLVHCAVVHHSINIEQPRQLTQLIVDLAERNKLRGAKSLVDHLAARYEHFRAEPRYTIRSSSRTAITVRTVSCYSIPTSCIPDVVQSS